MSKELEPLHAADASKAAGQLAKKIMQRILAMLREQHEPQSHALTGSQHEMRKTLEEAIVFAQTGEGSVSNATAAWLQSVLFGSVAHEPNDGDVNGEGLEAALVHGVNARRKLARSHAISLKEFASVARLTPRRVRQLVGTGELTANKNRTIPARDALRFLAARAVPGFSSPPNPQRKKVEL